MPLMETSLPQIEEALIEGNFAQRPYEFYRILRETAPVYWSPYLGQWLVTSSEHVEEVLLNPGEYSSFGFDSGFIGRLQESDAAPTLEHHFNQRGLIQADPPDHTRLRRTLARHFTSRSLASLSTTIDAAITSLLDAVSDDFDAIRDLAAPLPVSVIADLLGVSEDEREGFPRWSADAVRFFGTASPIAENARVLDSDLVQWRSLLFRLLEERRSEPANDLLSLIAEHVRQGDMSLEEALFTGVHLLIAGHETTTNLTGNGLHCLLTHRDALQAVREDPDRLENAIEEILRFEPPIQRIRRAAASETILGGQEINAGDPVIPILAAANRDPSRFSDPDTFDINRDFSKTSHLSFGRGVHFCIGAPLARMEAPAAISAVIERFPCMRLADNYEPEWRNTINLRGLQSLYIETQVA